MDNKICESEPHLIRSPYEKHYSLYRKCFIVALVQKDLDILSYLYDVLRLDRDFQPSMQNLCRSEIKDDFLMCGRLDSTKNVSIISKIIKYYEYLINKCFMRNKKYQKIFRECAEEFYSKCKMNNVLLTCCNETLQKDLTNEQFEKIFTEIGTVCRYIVDYESFKTSYMEMLKERIKSGRFNCKIERDLVSHFEKIDCITDFYVLKRAINDYEESTKMVEIFNAKNKSKLSFEFDLMILNDLYFGFPKTIELNVPVCLQPAIESFEKFYKSDTDRRKLSWNHTISSVDLQTNCFDRSYNFHCNMIQYAIFDIFNRVDSIAIDEIKQMIGTNSKVFETNLKTLLDMKILLMDQNRLTISFNLDLKSIPIQTSSTVPLDEQLTIDFCKMNGPIVESKNNDRFLESDRKALIQTRIVSIMKSERTLSRNDLIKQTIDGLKLRFLAKVSDVEEQMKYLVEKEYIEFKSDDMYHYIP